MKTILSLIFLSSLTLFGCAAVSAGRETSITTYSGQHHLSADTLEPFTIPVIALPEKPEESYVDDIPFDTRVVCAEYFISLLPKPEEELPVNDFPFDTKTIADRYLHRILPEIAPEPESYVDDIPFNTAEIAGKYVKCNFSRASGTDAGSKNSL